ncbi:MAG TPA: diguanylate cyclase [Gemmatimonadales bacterium]|nr:diguanylate cyclase [Gemmatimonadales bacterium]
MLYTIWRGASLRAWVGLGMALAIIPLVASAVGGYVVLKHGVIESLRDIASRQRNEIDPAQRLRLLLWETSPPLDEYMDEGDPRRPAEYRAARERVEAAFATVHAQMARDPEMQQLVERARDDWTAADRVATEALSVRRTPGDPHGAELMDAFDGLVQSSVDKLGAVYASLDTDLRADHDAALRAYDRAEWLAAAAAIVSLLAVLAGAAVIGRVMSGSVERLVEGAQRFAAGDRDHRIEVRVPPELHQVAQEFNRMIGRIHESEDALADLAQRDGLTRLLNRRAFDIAIAEVFARRQRMHESFALVLFDLDHFKSVNDTYGHAAGDEVLRAAAQAISSEMRPFDRLFRTGGEEFAAILFGVDADGALVTAERLRAMVSARPVGFEGKSILMTASGGVALPGANATPATLYQAADAALYRAKGAGRNRVVLAE